MLLSDYLETIESTRDFNCVRILRLCIAYMIHHKKIISFHDILLNPYDDQLFYVYDDMMADCPPSWKFLIETKDVNRKRITCPHNEVHELRRFLGNFLGALGKREVVHQKMIRMIRSILEKEFDAECDFCKNRLLEIKKCPLTILKGNTVFQEFLEDVYPCSCQSNVQDALLLHEQYFEVIFTQIRNVDLQKKMTQIIVNSFLKAFHNIRKINQEEVKEKARDFKLQVWEESRKYANFLNFKKIDFLKWFLAFVKFETSGKKVIQLSFEETVKPILTKLLLIFFVVTDVHVKKPHKIVIKNAVHIIDIDKRIQEYHPFFWGNLLSTNYTKAMT